MLHIINFLLHIQLDLNFPGFSCSSKPLILWLLPSILYFNTFIFEHRCLYFYFFKTTVITSASILRAVAAPLDQSLVISAVKRHPTVNLQT